MAACLPSPVCLVGRGSQGLGPLPGWPGSPLPGARVGVSCWHWLSVGQVNYPKVADSSSFDEDSSDALSPEQPASHESQGSVPSPLEARVSEPLPSATSVSPTQVSSCPGHWDLLVLPRVVFDLCQVGQEAGELPGWLGAASCLSLGGGAGGVGSGTFRPGCSTMWHLWAGSHVVRSVSLRGLAHAHSELPAFPV